MPDSKTAITILAGSGFSEGLGFPSTHNISEKILRSGGPALSQGNEFPVNISKAVNKALLSYYDEVNFEILLHAIETLDSLANRSLSTPDEFKSIHSAFMDPSPRWQELFEIRNHSEAGAHIVQAIIYMLSEHDRLCKQPEKLDSARTLFETLRDAGALIRFYNLNYDLNAEYVCGGFDGFFPSSEDISLFNREEFMRRAESEPILLHLHGAINYGISSDEQQVRIVKYADGQENCLKNKKWWLTRQSQARELVGVSPIVSGLRKMDKMFWAPFGYYNVSFLRSLMTCPNLFIIGYGGRDTYIDDWMAEVRELHGERFRIAIVTLLPATFTTNQYPILRYLPFFDRLNSYDEWTKEAVEVAERVTKRGQCLLIKSGFPVTDPDIQKAILKHFQVW